MGNESSVPVGDGVPPQTLESRTLEGVAKYIKEKKPRRIVVMTGAGISTSAGIPDFRSPDTGLYANLARLNLPFAEAVFDISYFRNNPLPFYALAHELYPGRYRPTLAHSFIKLLYDKGLLLKLFTQNIDCLEREAGVPREMIVEAHGSFATQRCIECKTEFPKALMKEAVEAKEVPRCLNKECNGLVKPDIVFFGEPLPEIFHQNRTLPASADLAIVMGTTLSVQPFASLPSFVREEVPRILINLERVGGLGSRADDVLLLGDCDEGVKKLADALGWLGELEELWQRTSLEGGDEKEQQGPPKTRDEKLEEEVTELTEAIDKTLQLTKDHNAWLRNDLIGDSGKEQGESENEPSKPATIPGLVTEAQHEREAKGPNGRGQGNEREEKTPPEPSKAQDLSVSALDKLEGQPQDATVPARTEHEDDQADNRELGGIRQVDANTTGATER